MIEPLNPDEMHRAELMKSRGCLPREDDAIWSLPAHHDAHRNERYHEMWRVLDRHIVGSTAYALDDLFRAALA